MILNNIPNKKLVYSAIRLWIIKFNVTSDDGEIENMSLIDFVTKGVIFNCWGNSLIMIRKEMRNIKKKAKIKKDLIFSKKIKYKKKSQKLRFIKNRLKKLKTLHL